MSQSRSQPAAQDFSNLKIVVAGDIMLDRYIYGDVTRIAPEAPVPVLRETRQEVMLGGAGNVLSNLRGLGVQTSIVAIIGEDSAGEQIRKICQSDTIATDGLLVLSDRPTTEKTRYVGNNQILIRSDRENASWIEAGQEEDFLKALTGELEGANALILSDYMKGALTDKIIRRAIDMAREKNIPVLVDPKRNDFSVYSGATIITPNLKELASATGMPVSDDDELVLAARKILQSCNINALVVTRSERGASVIDKSDSAVHIENEKRTVRGVSGAGDTFISTLASCVALGMTTENAARLANKACGIVVAKEGTTPIFITELLAPEIEPPHQSWEAARIQIARWKDQGLKVGFTNGCFDILHAGHVTYLQEAANFCDRLVVGLNHDKSVRILKGPTRPVNDETSRATVIDGLTSVDMVVLFGAENENGDNTPSTLLRYIQPDIIFKGGDYTEDQLPEAKVVREYGGDVKIMCLVEGKSTTRIIQKITAA